MRRTRFWITVAAWAVFALLHLGLLLLPPGLLQIVALAPTLLILLLLIGLHNRPLAQWRSVIGIWVAYCALRILTVLLPQLPIPFLRDNLANFAAVLVVEAMMAGWLALAILAIRRDVSVAYLVIFFATGPIILRALVQDAGGVYNFLTVSSGREMYEQFSLTEPMIMALSCMSTLGWLALIPHMLWLLIRELRGR